MAARISFDVDDLEFVQPLQEYFQLKCPICLELLLENPHLVSCCGHHICGSCLQSLGLKPCPLCKSNSFQKVPDKGYQRALGYLKIYCLNKKDGCPWTGELKELGFHMSREGNCLFARFPCKHLCGESILRSVLDAHELSQCNKRPATCSHCRLYQSTWESVQNHHDTCSCFPLACPNGCGQTIERKDMSDHTTNQCRLRKVKCEFSSVGCKWFDTEESFNEHLETSWREHISLVALHNSQELAKQIELIEKLNERVKDLESEVAELKAQSKVVEESQASGVTCSKDTADIENELSDTEIVSKKCFDFNSDDEDKFQITSLPSIKDMEFKDAQISALTSKGTFIPVSPRQCTANTFKLTVNRWHHKRDHNNLHYSSQFTIGPSPGYTMKITVHCNGIGTGYCSHLSVSSDIIKNPFTSWLTWPFRGSVLIKLVSQSVLEKDKYGVIIYDDEVDDVYCMPNSQPLGIQRFVSFQDIHPYLSSNNDALQFEIYEQIVY